VIAFIPFLSRFTIPTAYFSEPWSPLEDSQETANHGLQASGKACTALLPVPSFYCRCLLTTFLVYYGLPGKPRFQAPSIFLHIKADVEIKERVFNDLSMAWLLCRQGPSKGKDGGILIYDERDRVSSYIFAKRVFHHNPKRKRSSNATERDIHRTTQGDLFQKAQSTVTI